MSNQQNDIIFEQQVEVMEAEHAGGQHKPSEAKKLSGTCYECYKINKHNERADDYRITNHLAGEEN